MANVTTGTKKKKTFVRQNKKPASPDQRVMKNFTDLKYNTKRKGRILKIYYLLLVKQYLPEIMVDHACV
jgi:hypothetical protein